MTAPAYPDSPYGVAILLDFFSGPPQYHVQQGIINQCAALPVSWVKLIFSWSRVELTQGVYTWPAELDSAIQRFNAAGINVQYDITNPPKFYKQPGVGQLWGSAGGTSYYYATGAQMTTFAEAVATRYQTGSANGVISGIQLGNEDYDSSGEVGGSGNDNLLNGGWSADSLVQAYAAIKAIDTNMLVYSGAHLRPGVNAVTSWANQLNTGGGVGGGIGAGAYRDCSCGDFYIGNQKDPDIQYNVNVCTCAEFLSLIHQSDINNGVPNMDLRFTEVGWAATQNGGNGNVTYAQQAQFVGEVLADAMNEGACSHIFIYTMDYADKNSLVLSSSSVTPAYTTYQSFIAANPTWGSSGGLTVSPLALSFQTVQGSNPVGGQYVNVTNDSTSNATVSVATTYTGGPTNWVDIVSFGTDHGSFGLNASQTQPVEISVTNATGIAVGTYSATVTWTMGSYTATTTVQLQITASVSPLTATPSNVALTGVAGQTVQLAVSVSIISKLEGTVSSSVAYSSGASGWLSVVPPSVVFAGISGGTASVTCYANLVNLAAGSYYAIITFDIGGNTATTVINLTVTTSPKQPPPVGDILNSEGIVRYGDNSGNYGIPLGGSAQRILSMSTKPQPTVLNTLEADITRFINWIKENL